MGRFKKKASTAALVPMTLAVQQQRPSAPVPLTACEDLPKPRTQVSGSVCSLWFWFSWDCAVS